ncbi:hypothetical protein A2U01_0088521, partial [Trifolium medium]|nr:hypothetical protein [Trifolium medium]
GNADKGGAWLSSARAVRCWAKSRTTLVFRCNLSSGRVKMKTRRAHEKLEG